MVMGIGGASELQMHAKTGTPYGRALSLDIRDRRGRRERLRADFYRRGTRVGRSIADARACINNNI